MFAGYHSKTEEPKKMAKPVPKKEVLDRFDKDLASMEKGIGLMLANRLQEADQLLEAACQEVAVREIDFEAGDHDLRGAFKFVSTLMSLLNGLASLENNQFDIVLERVWAADELLALDGDWAGRNVLRGLCLLVAGVVEIMQQMPTKGVWHVLRSWLFLRNLETEALNFEGHERACVRSTALLALGVFNLFTSMLPPQAMKMAGWATGFTGGREVALTQLKCCWKEGGVQAPFAGMVLIGYANDVSSFLGELRAARDEGHKEAQQILDWANERYPGAFFFGGLEAGTRAACQDLKGAVAKLDELKPSVENLPALTFLIHVRRATFLTNLFEWEAAGDAFQAAVSVYRSVGRRAFCPSLSLNAHLCYQRAGNNEKAVKMLHLARSYRKEKKKWSPLDKVSLRQADLAFREAGLSEAEASSSPSNDSSVGSESPAATDSSFDGEAEVGDDEIDGSVADEKWRPNLILYLKMCLVYRGVNFMTEDGAEVFMKMVQEETEKQDDPDGKCIGLCIQAEAMRQTENWSEALRLAAEGAALAPDLTADGIKSGTLHFCYLVLAYAKYQSGKPAEAKEALTKIDQIGASDHFFQKQVEFKATHLKRLVGVEFEESYKEIAVPARGKMRLVADVPEGTKLVEWDFVLTDFTIDYEVNFSPAKEGSKAAKQLQKAEQYQASAGPVTGHAKSLGPGRLELVFSNSFSMLRGKTIECRLQPSSLKTTIEQC
eukprot:TRINITY_DN11962_c1_g1_i1.p1 TRINITY_DN11962_c1_g1~~TRINITY_DN11962_c1_g1_i1.p1  ORF type:complete len:719 (-),score=185.59 TRINITY_DN11962_c1_g1_i1:397-2553(-)